MVNDVTSVYQGMSEINENTYVNLKRGIFITFC